MNRSGEVSLGAEPKRRLERYVGRGALALVMAATLAAGCSSNGKEDGPRSTVTTTPSTTEAPTIPSADKLTAKQREAEAYITSDARVNHIAYAVTTFGAELTQADRDSKPSVFQFYNDNTGKWGRTNNEGWGHLQLGTQHNGSTAEVAILVYQDKDGTLDLGKGVQDFHIHVSGYPVVDFYSPDSSKLSYGGSVNVGWTTQVTDVESGHPITGSDIRTATAGAALHDSANHLQAIDTDAIDSLGAQMTALGFRTS